MSLSPSVSFKSRFVTHLLNFPPIKYNVTVCYLSLGKLISHSDVNKKTAVIEISLRLRVYEGEEENCITRNSRLVPFTE